MLSEDCRLLRNGGAELDVDGAVLLAGAVVVDATSGGGDDVLVEAASLDLGAAEFTLPVGIAVRTEATPEGRVALVAGVVESGLDAADPDLDPAATGAGDAGGCGCAGVAGRAATLPALLALFAVGRRRGRSG